MTVALPNRHSGTRETIGVSVMGMLMLICAVLASLALGVLVAYTICQAMFQVFRVHAISAARARVASQQSLRVARG